MPETPQDPYASILANTGSDTPDSSNPFDLLDSEFQQTYGRPLRFTGRDTSTHIRLHGAGQARDVGVRELSGDQLKFILKRAPELGLNLRDFSKATPHTTSTGVRITGPHVHLDRDKPRAKAEAQDPYAGILGGASQAPSDPYASILSDVPAAPRQPVPTPMIGAPGQGGVNNYGVDPRTGGTGIVAGGGTFQTPLIQEEFKTPPLLKEQFKTPPLLPGRSPQRQGQVDATAAIDAMLNGPGPGETPPPPALEQNVAPEVTPSAVKTKPVPKRIKNLFAQAPGPREEISISAGLANAQPASVSRKIGGNTQIAVGDLISDLDAKRITPEQFKQQASDRYAQSLGFTPSQIAVARQWGETQHAGYDPFELAQSPEQIIAVAKAKGGTFPIWISKRNVEVLEPLLNAPLLNPERAQAEAAAARAPRQQTMIEKGVRSVPGMNAVLAAGDVTGLSPDIQSAATTTGAGLVQLAKNVWDLTGGKAPSESPLARSLYEQADAEAQLAPGTTHQVVRGLARGGFELPKVVGATLVGLPTPVAFAALGALEHAHEGLTGAAKGTVEGAIFGAAPELAAGMPRAIGAPLMAGIGGVPAALEAATQGATPGQALTAALPGAIQMGVLGMLGGERPEGAHPRAEPPSVPEGKAALDAQMSALTEGRGTRKAVMVTPGETSPAVPKGYVATEVTLPGQTEPTTFIHDPKVVSVEAVNKSVEDGTFHKLLGIRQSKLGTELDAAAVARNAKGEELQAIVTNEAGVEADVKELKAQYPEEKYPGVTITVEHPAKVVLERIVNQEGGQANAVKEGGQQGGGEGKLPRVRGGENLPAHEGEVRGEAGQRAAGGGGAERGGQGAQGQVGELPPKEGLLAVYRGTGKRGAQSLRPSETGLRGEGVYFYDNPIDARAYATKEGGVLAGYVRPEDAEISGSPKVRDPKTGLMSGGRVILLKDPSKFIKPEAVSGKEQEGQVTAAKERLRAQGVTEPQPAGQTHPVRDPAQLVADAQDKIRQGVILLPEEKAAMADAGLTVPAYREPPQVTTSHGAKAEAKPLVGSDTTPTVSVEKSLLHAYEGDRVKFLGTGVEGEVTGSTTSGGYPAKVIRLKDGRETIVTNSQARYWEVTEQGEKNKVATAQRVETAQKDALIDKAFEKWGIEGERADLQKKSVSDLEGIVKRGFGKAPASNARTMMVNGESTTADLTPENAAKFDALDSDAATRRQRLKAQLDTVKPGSAAAAEIQAQMRGLAMSTAAEKRGLSPKFATGVEEAKAAKREATNYVGKQVEVGGRTGKVVGNPFGRVKVEFEDGTTKNFAPGEVKAATGEAVAPAETAPAPTTETPKQAAAREATAKLEALGPEPHKPSPEKRFFGSKGREGASPEVVARYDAEVKAYNAWRRKYNALSKANTEASNAAFYERQTAKASAPAESKPTAQPSSILSPDSVTAAKSRIAARRAKPRESLLKGEKGELDPQVITDLLIVGADHVRQGAKDFADWSKRMVDDIGEWARPHLRSVYDQLTAVTAKAATIAEDVKTGIKNATVNLEREQRSLDPIEKEARKAFGVSYDRGRARVDADPAFRDQVADWAKNPRNLTDEDAGALTYDRMRLTNERQAVEDRILTAQKSGDKGAEGTARVALARLNEQIADNDYANDRGGTQTARALSARRMMVKADYSLARLEQRATVANNGQPIPEETRAKLKDLSERLTAAEKTAAEYQEKFAKLEAERAVADIARQSTKRGARTATKEQLDTEFADLKKQFASERKKATAASGLAGIDPEGTLTKLVGQMARNRVRAGVTDAAQVVEDVYSGVKDYLEGSGLEKKDVRDAISGYGAPPRPTKGALAVEWAKVRNKLKREARDDDLRAEGIDPTQVGALKSYKTRLEKRAAELKQRIDTGDFSTAPPKRLLVLDPKARELQAEVGRLKNQADLEMRKIELSKRNAAQRMGDNLVKWRRAVLLSGSSTLMKLTSAATQRFGFTTIEEAIGTPLSKLLPGIAAKAPREGAGLNVRAEARAAAAAIRYYVEAAKDVRGMLPERLGGTEPKSQAARILKTGKASADVTYGKRQGMDLPPEAAEFFGHLHGMIKAPAKIAEFERSLTKRLEWAARNGEDISDPAVQAVHASGAYLDANRAILLQDNAFLNKMKIVMGKSRTAKFVFPIIKVPTNFAVETGSYAAGATRAAWLLRKGIGELSPDQADAVMRNLKKQTVGAGMMVLGYAAGGPDAKWLQVGGYYEGTSEEKKRGADQPKAGEMRFFGWKVPKPLQHTPPMEALQIGATLRRVTDLYQAQGKPGGRAAAALTTAKGLAENVPFYEETVQVLKASETPRGVTKYGGETLRSLVVPPDVQKIAAARDVNAAGEPIKRKPETVGEIMKMGVPGLRETVPTNEKMMAETKRRQLQQGLRKNPDDTTALDAALEAGTITPQQKREMIGEAKLSELQSSFKHLSLEDKFKVFHAYSPEQKAETEELLREAWASATGAPRRSTKTGKMGKQSSPSAPEAILKRLRERYPAEVEQ